jgi:hypothetical protein
MPIGKQWVSIAKQIDANRQAMDQRRVTIDGWRQALRFR